MKAEGRELASSEQRQGLKVRADIVACPGTLSPVNLRDQIPYMYDWELSIKGHGIE